MGVITIKKNASYADFTEGWKSLVISGAKKGKYDTGNQGKYIDIWFEGYPETVKLRAHAKIRKDTGEEFCIHNIFLNSNAGIVEVSEGEEENRVKIDIDPTLLIGKELQVFFYKNAKGYTDVSDNTAPAVPFENAVEKWTEERIEKQKKYAEGRTKQFAKVNTDNWDSPSDNGADTGPPTSEEEDDWND